jgi:hypothetical protein
MHTIYTMDYLLPQPLCQMVLDRATNLMCDDDHCFARHEVGWCAAIVVPRK